MTLTPAQRHLALDAARLLLQCQLAILEGAQRPRLVALPYEAAQCLLAAAAPELDLPDDVADLGAWQGPETAELAVEETPAEWHWPT